jgi:hypothetical protein
MGRTIIDNGETQTAYTNRNDEITVSEGHNSSLYRDTTSVFV